VRTVSNPAEIRIGYLPYTNHISGSEPICSAVYVQCAN